MDSTTLREIGITSCDDMLEQMTAVQKGLDPKKGKTVSMAINEVKSITRNGDYLTLSLFFRLSDTDSLGLCIDDKEFYFNDESSEMSVYFDDYEEQSMTVRAYPSDKLMDLLDTLSPNQVNYPVDRIKMIIDLKWLISMTRDCFDRYGGRLGYPLRCPSFREGIDYLFPAGTNPSQEQKDAVRTILNSKLSYIWGAPGTGKTQYVLATSIIAYIKKGGRVAILAPTNNSVEQVLRGVLKILEQDDPNHTYVDPEKDILRMGAATAGFIKDYPGICEDRARMTEIKKLKRENDEIFGIIFERKVDLLKPKFTEIQRLYGRYDAASDLSEKKRITDGITELWGTIVSVVKRNYGLAGLIADVDQSNLRSKIDEICDRLSDQNNGGSHSNRFKGLSEDELRDLLEENNKKLSELEPYDTSFRVKNVKIMAMTPFILMGRQSLFEPGGIVDVDHIFLDEAGYANLIQTMPIFMCGPPIAMLGDHMQLPPVCELEREHIKIWANRGDYMKYSFMWDQSARYIESYLFGTIEEARDDYLFDRNPRYRQTQLANLTCSHRFANNLAKILDDCVYLNGIKGDKGTLQIFCYDVKGLNPETRANLAEAEAVGKFIEDNKSDLDEFAIITPYTDQRKAISKRCGPKHDSRIMTIHGSQGREWDTVIISVSDNRTSSKPIPYRFTSSLPPYSGLRVINTAVSRAKKRLIIFCDYDFWSGMAAKGDLLGRLVTDKDTVRIPYGGDFAEYSEFLERRLQDKQMQDLADQYIFAQSDLRIMKIKWAIKECRDAMGKSLFTDDDLLNNGIIRGILNDSGLSPTETYHIVTIIQADPGAIVGAIKAGTDVSQNVIDSISASVGIECDIVQLFVSDVLEANRK